MSSTTIPTISTRTARTGRTVPRAAVTGLVVTLAVAIIAVLAFMAFPQAVGGSPARPTTAVDAKDMPTPQWLERYLDPKVTDGGPGDPTGLRSPTSTKGGAY